MARQERRPAATHRTLVIELLQWAAGNVGEAPELISAASVERAARYLSYAHTMLLRCLGELAMT